MQNHGYICRGCADDRHKAFQENLEDNLKKITIKLEAGDECFVKSCFEEGEVSEHMWTAAEKIDWEKSVVVGKLDHYPVKLKNVKCGDEVSIPFTALEQIL